MCLAMVGRVTTTALIKLLYRNLFVYTAWVLQLRLSALGTGLAGNWHLLLDARDRKRHGLFWLTIYNAAVISNCYHKEEIHGGTEQCPEFKTLWNKSIHDYYHRNSSASAVGFASVEVWWLSVGSETWRLGERCVKVQVSVVILATHLQWHTKKTNTESHVFRTDKNTNHILPLTILGKIK